LNSKIEIFVGDETFEFIKIVCFTEEILFAKLKAMEIICFVGVNYIGFEISDEVFGRILGIESKSKKRWLVSTVDINSAVLGLYFTQIFKNVFIAILPNSG
jgi:hypothetical protein